MEKEIDFWIFFNIAFKRFKLIIVIVVVAVIAAYILTPALKVSYKATVSIMILPVKQKSVLSCFENKTALKSDAATALLN